MKKSLIIVFALLANCGKDGKDTRYQTFTDTPIESNQRKFEDAHAETKPATTTEEEEETATSWTDRYCMLTIKNLVIAPSNDTEDPIELTEGQRVFPIKYNSRKKRYTVVFANGDHLVTAYGITDNNVLADCKKDKYSLFRQELVTMMPIILHESLSLEDEICRISEGKALGTFGSSSDQIGFMRRSKNPTIYEVRAKSLVETCDQNYGFYEGRLMMWLYPK